VLGHVVQRFLRHAIQAQGDRVGQVLGNAGGIDRDREVVCGRQVGAQPLEGGDQPQELEPGWVQAVRGPANVAGQGLHLAVEIAHGRPRAFRAGRQRLLQQVQVDTQQREPLQEVVVELAGEAGALRLLAFDQPPGQPPDLVGRFAQRRAVVLVAEPIGGHVRHH